MVHFSLNVVLVNVESVYDSPLQSHCRARQRLASLRQSTTVHFSLTVVLVYVESVYDSLRQSTSVSLL